MLHATHRALARQPGAQPERIRDMLRAEGHTRVHTHDVERYIGHLQQIGMVDDRRRLLMEPLYPAYLVAALSEAERREMRRRLEQSDAELRRPRERIEKDRWKQLELFLEPAGEIESLEGDLNTLIRLRATRTTIDTFGAYCRAAGGVVRVYVVDETEPVDEPEAA